MSTMTCVRANGVELGVETFGRDDDPLVLLAGGPTMLSWPDSVCERLAAGGRRVVRYDLRDAGASATADPEAPGYDLRDLAADAAALPGALGAVTAHLGGAGVGGMVRSTTTCPITTRRPWTRCSRARCPTGPTDLPSPRSPPTAPRCWAMTRSRPA
jgi:hypothetical protein